MGLRTAQFWAIVLTALALVPAGAHLMALPNKIGLEERDYFTVQQIYRGWALAGIAIIAAFAANLVLAARLRGAGRPFWFALAAATLVMLSLVIFFVWNYPANQATVNWTAAPDDWRALRAQWEYAHALNALVLFLALCAATAAGLGARRA